MPDASRAVGNETAERFSSVSDLCALVVNASASGKPLWFRGGRTHAAYGNPIDPGSMVVDLTGLDQIIDYSQVDLTMAVEPGVRIASIDGLLAESSQRLALDVPNRGQATIGGTFAAGLSGPRRLRYGSLKDMVIGAEVVNSAGKVTKSGGMVVKNVSGYEIARLHYGAHGAFGPISRLNLKVLPLAESRVEVRCTFDTPADSLSAAVSVLVSSLDPAAVYVSRRNARRWTLHVQIEGNERFTRLQREQVTGHIARVVRPAGVEMVELDLNSTPVFDEMIDLNNANDELVARLSVPASGQAQLLGQFEDEPQFRILADAGSGLVYVRAEATAEALHFLSSSGVPITYLTLPPQLRNGIDVFGRMDGPAAAIVKRVKDEFDPNRIFNRGRFVHFL